MNFWEVFGLGESDRNERSLFFITVGLILLITVVGLISPQFLNDALNGANSWILTHFGWWLILLGGIVLLPVLYMVFSEYGNIRIGGEDTEPEFDLFSWLSLVFTVGWGSAIVIWGVGEPISIVAFPPPEPYPVQGASIESMALAFAYLHDILPGLIVLFFPFTLAFALGAYTQELDDYKLSAVLDTMLKTDRYKRFYWLVDLSALVAIVGGIATTIGFTAQQLGTILSNTYGMQSNALIYGLFAVIGLVFVGDIWLGLKKGIRNAARATVILSAILVSVLLVVGPTGYILNISIDALGVWLNNMVRLMLYTAPSGGGTWAQSWTSFWWAWWISWGLFVGSFIARISKGRTIRQVFIASVFIPGVAAWIQHSVYGGWVLAPGYIEPVQQALTNDGVPAALAEAITITPFSNVVGVLFVLVIIGYVITTIDSAVYTLSQLTLGVEEPNAYNRAWWGIILAVLGIMTIELPGFSGLRSIPPVMGLALSFLLVVLIVVSYIAARDYVREEFGGLNPAESTATSAEQEPVNTDDD